MSATSLYPDTRPAIMDALTEPNQERWTIKALAAFVIREAQDGWPLTHDGCGGECCWHPAPTAADEAQILADVHRVIERLDAMGRLSTHYKWNPTTALDDRDKSLDEYQLIDSGVAPFPFS